MPTDLLQSTHDLASSLQAAPQRLADSDFAGASRAAIASFREAVPDASRAAVESVREAVPAMSRAAAAVPDASRAAVAAIRDAVPDMSHAAAAVRDAVPGLRPRRRRTGRRLLLAMGLLGAVAVSLAVILPMVRRWADAASPEPLDELDELTGPTPENGHLPADQARDSLASDAVGVTGL